MDEIRDAPVPEGEEPKSATAVVEEVLVKKCPSSTFLLNVGLKSSSSTNKTTRSDPAVVAQVIDLQGQLERSQHQGQAMREELAELKKKAEEAASAQAIRDKEYEVLRMKAEETDAKFARLMAMMLSGK
jgi:hypothetical protein